MMDLEFLGWLGGMRMNEWELVGERKGEGWKCSRGRLLFQYFHSYWLLLRKQMEGLWTNTDCKNIPTQILSFCSGRRYVHDPRQHLNIHFTLQKPSGQLRQTQRRDRNPHGWRLQGHRRYVSRPYGRLRRSGAGGFRGCTTGRSRRGGGDRGKPNSSHSCGIGADIVS